jgi:hypothetical protein
MAIEYSHSVRAVVFDCIEKCGETFTLPVELINSDPATRGSITFTVRVNGTDSETLEYINHCVSHFAILDGD